MIVARWFKQTFVWDGCFAGSDLWRWRKIVLVINLEEERRRAEDVDESKPKARVEGVDSLEDWLKIGQKVSKVTGTDRHRQGAWDCSSEPWTRGPDADWDYGMEAWRQPVGGTARRGHQVGPKKSRRSLAAVLNFGLALGSGEATAAFDRTNDFSSSALTLRRFCDHVLEWSTRSNDGRKKSTMS
jgi:hypothetical protein